jgi:hypothetical protein
MTTATTFPTPFGGHRNGGHAGRRSLRPRLVAWWHGAAFDDALAAGVDPDSDVRLAAHAARLARPHCLEALADGLERAVADAERPRRPLSAAVPVRAGEVIDDKDGLLALAALLRSTRQPSPRALALTRRLLIDGASPLYVADAPQSLRDAVAQAAGALGDGTPSQA